MVILERRPSIAPEFIGKRVMYKTRAAAIDKFADLGLSGREISFAIEIETGLKIKPDYVKNLVHQARLRGTVRKLWPEEIRDIAKTTANTWDYTDDVVKKDVLSILQNIKRLQEEGKPLPQNRLELRKFRIPHNGTNQKEEGIKTGNKIVFPDGRHIPTFEGLSQTEKQRQNARERNRGPKPREQVIRQSTIWSKVKPLRERLALSSEIAEITGFTRKQVKGVIDRNSRRPEWSRSPALTPEQVIELKRRSGKAKKPRNLKDRKLPTQDEKNTILFAQKLVEKGLIASDLASWNKLNSLYESFGKELPLSFYDKLRLEVFLASRSTDAYHKLGCSIDAKWFEEKLSEDMKVIGGLVSSEELDRRYLMDLLNARRLWSETGDKTLIDNFPRFYVQKDPTRPRRLRSQIELIQKATPVNNHSLIKENALVIHGEVKYG